MRQILLAVVLPVLVILLYFLVPWTAVNLIDFFVVRRGKYSIPDLFTPRGIYGAWSARGLIAYAVGFVAMIPFFSISFFVGPVAQLLGGADFSFVIGLIVSGGLYLLLTRNLDLSTEHRAIQASIAELEGRVQ